MQTPWIRLVLAISLDGRLALPGRAKVNLGGVGDRFALEEALAWSDGTIMGGGTIRAHRSTCLIHKRELIERRQVDGRPKQPISLIVSRREGNWPDWPFFHQPIKRWLISPKKDFAPMKPPNGFERQIFMQSNWSKTLCQLYKEGLSKLILLGGAQLATSFLQSDNIDELQLTFTPRIIGGEHTWVRTEINDLPEMLTSSNAWCLKSIERLKENELLVHYLRNRSIKFDNICV